MTTNRFLIRQFTNNDLENVYQGLSDPEVIKYYGISFDSLEATKEQIIWFSQLEKDETGIWWAIESIENQEFCGAIGFNNLNKEHKRAEIGFWLLPKSWGKGIISEVLPLVCQYAYENLGLHRIEAQVETENLACKNVLEKNNFLLDGTLKDYEFKDGKYVSLDLFALINPKDVENFL
jgi:[ribosomal protein S5]-alanine N-acetyltransferase